MSTSPTTARARPGTGLARLLDACRRRQADATPVWYMRQAGSMLPGYRALRERYSVLEIAKSPELCAAVSLMPVREFGVDGAVMFADIMLPLERMGLRIELLQTGPAIDNPVRSTDDIARLRVIEPQEDVPFVLEAIRMVKRELDGQQAVIGFSGGPFTLACYMIEGGPSREFGRAKGLMYREPEAWDQLMAKVTATVTGYLLAQVDAGADVIQLFDSWVGALNPDDYARYAQPYVRSIFAALKATGVPTIHFGTSAATLLESLRDAGGDVISVDARLPLDAAWARIGHDRGIQGNLDGARLLAGWEATEAGARDVLDRAAGRPGHIFNLGHGMLPDSDPDLLRRLAAYVHETTNGVASD